MAKNTAALAVGLVAGALAIGCGSVGGPAAPAAPSASNPPAAAAATLHPPEALVSACYDCHSDQGASAWNVHLAPTYWFAGSARKDLDFSAWAQYDTARREAELLAIAKSVREGSMPPHDYKLLHPSGKLTEADKDAILDWTSAGASPSAASRP